MIKTIILIFLSMLLKATFPQQTFYTHIHDDNEHKPWDIVIKPDGNMLFSSFYRSDDTSWSSIWELDQAGDIINEWKFTNTSEEHFRGTELLEVENHIFFFGLGQSVKNGNTEKFVSMRKFDIQLNEIESYCYNLSGITYLGSMPIKVIYRDLSFHIFTSVEYAAGWFIPAYFKVSQTGTKIHSAFLPPSSDQVLLPYDMCLMPGSDNLFTVVFDGLAIYNTLGVFTEFDTAMNIVSQFPLINDSGPSIPDFGILEDSDSTFYTMYNVGTPAQFNSIVDKRNIEGNIINQFVFECPEDSASYIAYRNALDTLPDGNLIFCVTKNIDFYSGVQQEPTQIRFFKLRPNLELIWQKFLFGDDGNYRVWSMKAHPDGGIVVSGTFSRTPPLSSAMEIFFMKTDSEGQLTHIGDDKQQIKTTEAILFPTPAQDFVIVDFSLLYKTATLQLIDLAGRPVFEWALTSNHQQVDISGVPAGTYVYRIFNNKGLEESGKLVVE